MMIKPTRVQVSSQHSMISMTSRANITSPAPAKTTGELIRYLSPRPNQKWYVFNSARKKAHPINVGVYEEFSAPDDAMEWRRTAVEGSILSSSSA